MAKAAAVASSYPLMITSEVDTAQHKVTAAGHQVNTAVCAVGSSSADANTVAHHPNGVQKLLAT